MGRVSACRLCYYYDRGTTLALQTVPLSASQPDFKASKQFFLNIILMFARYAAIFLTQDVLHLEMILARFTLQSYFFLYL